MVQEETCFVIPCPNADFEFLLACLRFDDSDTREERKKGNPASAISKIFDSLIQNSPQCFNLGSSACVDKVSITFRSRCEFKMYMSNKNGKCGIKLFKQEIPKEFLPSKSREIGSTVYGVNDSMMKVSRVPKKSKRVLLVSSMHHGKGNSDTDKPEIMSIII